MAGIGREMHDTFVTFLFSQFFCFENQYCGLFSTQILYPFLLLLYAIFSGTGKLWIPAMILNIAFVTPMFRVLYDNVIFFGWTIFLSMTLNSNNP
jgi:hypothetical protein